MASAVGLQAGERTRRLPMNLRAGLFLFTAALPLVMASCDVTTELTKAPFELSSLIVRPTTDFTSSTTPGATGATGPARDRERLEYFVATSDDHIRTDVSRGGGEYLTSLAALAGVPPSSRHALHELLQDQYEVLYEVGQPVDVSWARVVETAWSAGYGRSLR